MGTLPAVPSPASAVPGVVALQPVQFSHGTSWSPRTCGVRIRYVGRDPTATLYRLIAPQTALVHLALNRTMLAGGDRDLQTFPWSSATASTSSAC